MKNKQGLSKKEQYELQKQEKKRQEERDSKKEMSFSYAKKILWVIVGVLLLGGLVWAFASAPEINDSDVVSRGGIHWHPHLEIIIHGERQEMPANLGLGAVHNPMHTHDPDGVIHLEYNGLVREDDIRLGKFFELWGREFNENQIFEHLDGEAGNLVMTVNGEPNDEYGNYLMQDGDRVVIRYE